MFKSKQRIKKDEIKQGVNLVFKDFKFDSSSKQIIETAHKLLKAYEENGDITYYDIDDRPDQDRVSVFIRLPNNEELTYGVFDDGK